MPAMDFFVFSTSANADVLYVGVFCGDAIWLFTSFLILFYILFCSFKNG